MSNSKKIDEGGFAFPTSQISAPDGRALSAGQDGMSLRDWLAGQALPQAIADYDRETRSSDGREWVLPYATKGTGPRELIIARQAYRYADAMIAARKAGAA